MRAAAARVNDPKARTAYLDMAARWRKMAERQQAIDEFLEEVIAESFPRTSRDEAERKSPTEWSRTVFGN
jgi:hypothetical protein